MCTKYGVCDICAKNCKNENKQCVRSETPGKFTCKDRCNKKCNEKGDCVEIKGKSECVCKNGQPNYPTCEEGCGECKAWKNWETSAKSSLVDDY
jgi:hypothetical protein